ncbi:hypothetical protein MKX01_015581 [Papaver californicum]|nr:hypothetical protein MKX01_015581 [Papaver californicum]
MDLKTASTYYYQAPSSTPLEGSTTNTSTGYYNRDKENPFDDTFSAVDPLCKLNLKETSEFVKSFPMKRDGSVSSVQSNNNNRRLMEAPPTPGRPVFSFSSSVHSRKGFPSKWDNAEKWIISTTHDSPAHHHHHPFVKPSSQNEAVFQQKSEIFSENKSVKVKSFEPTATTTVSVSAFPGDGGAEVLLKDKFTNNIEPAIFPNFRYAEPTKEGFLFRNSACESMKDAATEMVPQIQHRDIGTEMTPLGSSTTSRCHTPFKISSPARHNTPQDRSGLLATPKRTSTNINISEHHFAKLELGTQFDSVTPNWSSREEEEEEISKSLRHFDGTSNGGGSRKHNAIEVKASSWEEEERKKFRSRYKREEAKIQAWVNLQSAKAEAQSKKLEVKIQRKRSNLEEKIMKRMAIVHRKAEELRSEAQFQHSQQVQRATEQAQKMILKNQQQQNSSYYISDHTSCGCFPCNNHHF